MAKRATEAPPTCRHCGEEVREVGGKVITRGKAPAFRHVERPVGCVKGDPLFEQDVRGAQKQED